MQTPTLARPTKRASASDIRHPARSTPTINVPWRNLLVVGSVIAVAVPALWTDSTLPIPIAADLARLLRTMAVLKALIAGVSLGVVWWRFAFPVLPRFALAYVGGSWLMASGSVVMWQLTHLLSGAIVFHTGLALVLLSAWRDTVDKRTGKVAP